VVRRGEWKSIKFLDQFLTSDVGSRVELNRTDLNRAKHRGGKSDIHNSREKFPRKARLGVSSFKVSWENVSESPSQPISWEWWHVPINYMEGIGRRINIRGLPTQKHKIPFKK
jgi:hypothetical protein